jgi:hypothetical protein
VVLTENQGETIIRSKVGMPKVCKVPKMAKVPKMIQDKFIHEKQF